MNKDTIELERIKDCFYIPNGHVGKWNESVILDKIIKWSKSDGSQIYNVSARNFITKKVYKHILRSEKENISKEQYSQPPGGQKNYFHDLVYYLDIYWQ